MMTISDRLYDRLANARITPQDGAQLIALLELVAGSVDHYHGLDLWTVNDQADSPAVPSPGVGRPRRGGMRRVRRAAEPDNRVLWACLLGLSVGVLGMLLLPAVWQWVAGWWR